MLIIFGLELSNQSRIDGRPSEIAVMWRSISQLDHFEPMKKYLSR